MKDAIKRLIVWLGVSAVLTVTGIVCWSIVSGGSQSTASLKWLQFVQTVCTFALPPLLCAWLWDEGHRPFRWLKMDKGLSPQTVLLVIGTMVCALPAINLLAELNSRIDLPESLDFIEEKMKEYEANAALLTERFLAADHIGMMVVNMGLMAVLPALSEELTFRGTLQQLMHEGTRDKGPGRKEHVAIWVTAILFSAIHMQFYGFVPRMLMGAMFGYVFLWTGSLWAPVLMHFTNNAIAVVAYYVPSGTMSPGEKNYADTFGAGTTWWAGVLSLLAVGVLLWFTYRGQRGYVHRTRTE